jgi:Domain of unknown function (DUF4149)
MARVSSGWQLSLSLAELIGLAIWIGGLAVILTTVIPAVFNTLGMEQGGRFLRKVFDGYNNLTSGIALLLLGTAALRTLKVRQMPERILAVSPTEWCLLFALVGVTGLIVLFLGPKAIELQELAFATETPEAKKPAYDAFFRTHMIVRALHLINGGLAISILVVKFRQWMRHRAAFGLE